MSSLATVTPSTTVHPRLRTALVAPPLVLLAAESAPLRETLAERLRRESYRVIGSPSVQNFLAHLSELLSDTGWSVRPVAIICDLRMTGMETVRATGVLKSIPSPPPLICLAGPAEPHWRERAEALGAAALFHSPLDIGTITAVLNAVAKPQSSQSFDA